MKREKKNRVILVSIMILLLGTLIQGCVKPVPPVGPEELKPTLEVSTTPVGVLPYGSEFTLSWNTINVRSLTVNGKQQYPVSIGSLTLKLFRDTIFEVKATNIFLSAKADKEVKVGDWTTSKLGLITHGSWYMTANKCYRDGVLLVSFALSEEDKATQYLYTTDGKHSVYRSGIMVGYMDWIFSSGETSLTYGPNTQGPSTYDIAHLSETKFVITRIKPYADGLPCLAEVTYERK